MHHSLNLRALPGPALAVALLQAFASGQGIDWLTFVQDDSRLVGATATSTGDMEERDLAWGDLDQDGWIDLVAVRKVPFVTQGRRPNILFMNEGGFLVDRTLEFATTSDVPGDEGFDTPTNDRDVVIADVDGDGWDDVITSTAFSPSQPKHISHPRIYINLGTDSSGKWLGLRHEDARFPQITLVGGGDTVPFFNAVAAGDVNGDGAVDLYFADHDQMGFADVDDRLLINDGSGFFTDETTSRLTAAMSDSPFGLAAVIEDMNGDGVNDIVKCTGLGQTAGDARVDISYNDLANEGVFNLLQTPNLDAPYHVNVGDLNRDGLPDLVTGNDGDDRYLLNQGNDSMGRVLWSTAYAFNTDDGFAGNIVIEDLDDDGWFDVLIADVDTEIPGFHRRMHLYRNLGGTVGGFVDIDEQTGQGFRGAKGLTTALLRCTFDMAVFDIDNDGDKDLVTARCEGANVWLNQLDQEPGAIGTIYCTPAVANSTGVGASIGATGLETVSDNDLTLTTTQMPTFQFSYYLVAPNQGLVNNPGGSQGDLCVTGPTGRFIDQVGSTGADGTYTIQVDLTSMPSPTGNIQVMAGETWNFQAWYRDVNPSTTSNFSDAVSITFM